jgi:murein DD-endopeptidase MepM/ murein hydrolase activator NlpD
VRVRGLWGMHTSVLWSGLGRCALVTAAAGAMISLGGCSSGVSRFDFPSFGLTRSQDAPLADGTTTASLPVPPEPVYGSGTQNYAAGSGSYSQSSLPPAAGNYNAASPAYSSTGADFTTQSVRPQQAAYAPPAYPRAQPAVLRTATPARTEMVTVASGDNLYSLSRRYGVSVGEIQSANNLTDTQVHVGQRLVIPGAGYSKPRSAARVAARDTRPAPLPSPKPEAPAVHSVRTTTIPAPDKAQSSKPAVASSDEVIGGQNPQVAKVDPLPAPEPMSGNSFRWPVQGRIISAFGTKPDGGHNDGINVAVPAGTSVKAAENGVVAYAGNELKGYGNLVLIRHSNNWVSAYAHNDEILVHRGEQVRRGQVIAKAGNTGQVTQPQLHFELRKGSRPVDPTKYMSQTQASAD